MELADNTELSSKRSVRTAVEEYEVSAMTVYSSILSMRGYPRLFYRPYYNKEYQIKSVSYPMHHLLKIGITGLNVIYGLGLFFKTLFDSTEGSSAGVLENVGVTALNLLLNIVNFVLSIASLITRNLVTLFAGYTSSEEVELENQNRASDMEDILAANTQEPFTVCQFSDWFRP